MFITMKKLFLILLVFPALLYASPVDPATALKVAENFINSTESSNTNARKMPRKLKRMVSHSASAENQQYYIFNSEDSCGFVIVSADNCATPILGYSTEGYIDPNNLPIQLKDLLQAYNDEIQYAVDNNTQTEDSIKDLWSRYKKSSLSHNTTAVVNELISTKWNQYPYYNIKCPADASLPTKFGGHTTTGCVATAMAQIMKYWEYPNQGTGYKKYDSQHYGQLSANFAITSYDWANMPLKLSSTTSSVQNKAIATLMYQCGVAVSMNYNSDGNGSSGAQIMDDGSKRACSENAFKNYFGYASTTQGKKWNASMTRSSWIKMLKTELDNRRPVLYAGFSSSGGHAFVCDGYDNNDNFHFNWGWGGSDNGYFSLTASTSRSIYYPNSQQAVIGIKPKDGSSPAKNYDLYMNTDLTTTNTSSSNTYTFGKNLAFTAKVENNGTGIFNGSLKVAVFNNDGEFMAWSNESYHFSLEAGHNTVEKTYTFDGGIPFIPGKYRAYMYFQDDDETDCKLVKTDEGIIWTEYNNILFTISSSSNLQPVSTFQIDDLFGDFTTGSKIRIFVDVKNTASSTTFYGNIRLCLYNPDKTRALIIDELDYSNGFSAGSTKSLPFLGFVDVEPGTYYLALTYCKQGQTSWYYMGCSSVYPNPIPIKVVAPTIYADDFEINNTQSTAATLQWSLDPEMWDFSTFRVSLHEESDIDYYKLLFPSSNKYTVTIDLYDKSNPYGWGYVNADAQFAYSVNGSTYSDFYKKSKPITFYGPATLYILVNQYGLDGLGFYELAGDIEETAISALDEINEESAPSKYINNGQLYIIRNGATYTIQGSKITN